MEAEAFQSRGELKKAEDAYLVLLPSAPDSERRRWLEFNLAMLARTRGDEADAQRQFQEIHSAGIVDAYGAQALFELAGNGESYDRDRLWEVVNGYPDTHSAERALSMLNESPPDWQAHIKSLEILASKPSELQDNAFFYAAQIKASKEDENGAMTSYRKLYETTPDAALADDALWEIAQIYVRHQEWDAALSVLSEITSDVESSWFIGDYNSTYLDDAIYQTGLIQMLFLSDYNAARVSFDRFLELYPVSIRSDDAAWNLVQMWRLEGDGQSYLRAAEKFYKTYPDSRYTSRSSNRAQN